MEPEELPPDWRPPPEPPSPPDDPPSRRCGHAGRRRQGASTRRTGVTLDLGTFRIRRVGTPQRQPVAPLDAGVRTSAQGLKTANFARMKPVNPVEAVEAVQRSKGIPRRLLPLQGNRDSVNPSFLDPS